MGRLRARLVKSEADRELLGHLAEAERHLDRAIGVCRRAIKSEMDRVAGESRKASDAERAIRTAAFAIKSVGGMTPAAGLEDPDFVSDSARARKEAEQHLGRALGALKSVPERSSGRIRKAQDAERAIQAAFSALRSLGGIGSGVAPEDFGDRGRKARDERRAGRKSLIPVRQGLV